MDKSWTDIESYLLSVNQWGDAYGALVIRAMILLVIVLIVVRLSGGAFAKLLKTFGFPERRVAFVITGLHILSLAIMGLVVLHMLGFQTLVLFRVVVLILLGAIAAFVIFKPFIPQLPFVTGDTIMSGDIVGKVMGITFIHTHLKTFDGKSVMIPNHKVLNEKVVNYTTNPTRRVDVDFFIPLDQDLGRIKETVGKVLAADERVRAKPAARIVVTGFEPGYVKMQARFWVERKWVIRAKWELAEAIKKGLDAKGIPMAVPFMELGVSSLGGGG